MTVVPAGCSCGGNGVCLVCAIAAFDEVYPPIVEPTDEPVARPADSRSDVYRAGTCV